MRHDLHNDVAKVAHELYEERGRDHGYDLQDWLEAERIVLRRIEKSAEKAKPKKSSAKTVKKTGK